MKLLLYCLAAGLLVGGSFGCRCALPHPQNAVCAADFAIKGLPVFVAFIPLPGNFKPPHDPKELFDYQNYHYRLYVVKVLQVFKGSGIFEGQVILIRTAGSSAACGMKITEYNKDPVEWLLVGTTANTTNSINSCGWNRHWSDLTSGQIQNLNTNQYLDNCKCPIVTCPGHRCNETPACKWSSSQNRDCFINNLYCKRQHGDKGCTCKWVGQDAQKC